MVVWLIGLSGSGKTTIGREVHRILRQSKPNVVFLDGDSVREVMCEDLGYTLTDRRRNADRICRLCKLLDDQGIDVVCGILSLFEESREWNRSHYSDYFEVYLQVSLDELKRRDPKDLYRKASVGEAKNVAGVDLEFIPPENSDLIIDNGHPEATVEKTTRMILEALPSR